MRRAAFVLTALLLLCAFAATVQAQQYILCEPVADTVAFSFLPNLNFGASEMLTAENTQIIRRYTIVYVKYKMDWFENLKQRAINAKLENVYYGFTIHSVTGSGKLIVAQTSPSWDEMSLTWNNRPLESVTLAEWVFNAADRENWQYVRINVPLENLQLADEIALMLYTVSDDPYVGTAVTIYSREWSPQLGTLEFLITVERLLPGRIGVLAFVIFGFCLIMGVFNIVKNIRDIDSLADAYVKLWIFVLIALPAWVILWWLLT